MAASRLVRYLSTATMLAIPMVAGLAPFANAQYPDFASRCRTPGPQQLDACLAASRYQPNDPELMTRLGDALLASRRPGSAFDAYNDALALQPDIGAARAGRDEALRQINGRTAVATVIVPYQPILPPPSVQPVAAMPFDGLWSGRIEPRGQSFAVQATVVGGQLHIHYEDTTDRVTLDGIVDSAGYFSGKGFLKDKNKSSGDGGDPLAISGRFTQDGFEGTGSAGTKSTAMRLNRDS
ncbi:MAG: hypothetical protein IT563_22125 [Alphaproteobacteria bacterium]|nr:hypothetical protein [Alphaproteobacteria bacterium]